MKKLALLLLIAAFQPHLSTSQTIIRIAGDVDAKMVKSQVYRSLDYLDIHEPMHLYIVFSRRLPKKFRGITLCLPFSGSTSLFRIMIDAGLNETRRLNLLAHEMMHVKQYLSGDLQVRNDREIVWKGKVYPFNHRNLHRNPWEVEAYRHDQYLAKVLREKPNLQPQMASKVKP